MMMILMILDGDVVPALLTTHVTMALLPPTPPPNTVLLPEAHPQPVWVLHCAGRRLQRGVDARQGPEEKAG